MCLRGSSLALLAIASATWPAALAEAPLVEVRVTGNERLPSAAIITASGLHTGATVARSDLDAAAQRLFDTGFFKSVNYRYDVKSSTGAPGYVVTLLVGEEPARTEVQLDIPGTDEATLWPDLKRTDPFIDRLMPDNERAVAYYQRAIESSLRKLNREQPIVMKSEVDLATGKMVADFLPANLPRVSEVRFEGNRVLSTADLQAATAKLVMGQEYTDRTFRRIVELNLRPLYEEQGHLTVTFPRITITNHQGEEIAVKVEISEGPLWSLGKIELTGDGIPADQMLKAANFAEGKPANWKQFQVCIGNMERVLKADGYLEVSSKPVRSFHDERSVVDVAIQVRKGPQFLFGALRLNGLSSAEERQAIKLWRLEKGQPLNEAYFGEYLKSMLKSLNRPVKSVNIGTRPGAGTNIMDVVITIR